jgi:hypothetical protein
MSLVPRPQYDSFDSLPLWTKDAIRRFCSDEGETWVREKIPALDGQTFLEVMNDEDGESNAGAYFNKVLRGREYLGSSIRIRAARWACG